MSADFFLDTNIVAYTFDQTDTVKRDIAQKLLQHAVASGAGVVSYQVVQEFLSVTTTKFKTGMTREECLDFVDCMLKPMCRVHSHFGLYRQAVAFQMRYRFGFYDSLIVAAALEAGCSRLYTEDLQSGQVIDSLTIINPFAETHAVHEPLADYLPVSA